MQSLSHFPDRQQCSVLATALDQTDVGAVDTHARCHFGLAKPRGFADATNIRPEELADIHPKLRNRSRILMRRIIILGISAGARRSYAASGRECSPLRRTETGRLSLNWETLSLRRDKYE